MKEGLRHAAWFLLVLGFMAPPAGYAKAGAVKTVVAKSVVFESTVNNYFFKKYDTDKDANKFGQFVAEHYLQMFANYQDPKVLKQLSDTDLRALFDVTVHTANLNIENSRYRNYLLSDFKELKNRGAATHQQAQNIYYLLYAARLFDQARQFAIRHPGAHLPSLPSIRNISKRSETMPTVLMASADKNEYVRKTVDPKHGAKIVFVVSPGCHFAAHGLQAINADPELKKIFQENAIWVAPDIPLMHFDEYQKWNRNHPREKIGVAYLASEWPKINYWGLPTFYFFKDGVLVKMLTGWWPNPPAKSQYRNIEGNIPNLKKALRDIGLLKNSA